MSGFFSLPREYLMPFYVSSIHCNEGRAEYGGRRGTETVSLSWWRTIVFPTINLYTPTSSVHFGG